MVGYAKVADGRARRYRDLRDGGGHRGVIRGAALLQRFEPRARRDTVVRDRDCAVAPCSDARFGSIHVLRIQEFLRPSNDVGRRPVRRKLSAPRPTCATAPINERAVGDRRHESGVRFNLRARVIFRGQNL